MFGLDPPGADSDSEDSLLCFVSGPPQLELLVLFLGLDGVKELLFGNTEAGPGLQEELVELVLVWLSMFKRSLRKCSERSVREEGASVLNPVKFR